MRIYRIRYFDGKAAENKCEEFTGKNAYQMAQHRADFIKSNFGYDVIISYYTETAISMYEG